MAAPRGLRNNNPGNIDYNPRNQWQGQLGIEEGVPHPRFARFDSAENGIRAMAKLILNYRGKDGEPGVGKPGIDTVHEVISRWAPDTENNTKAYTNAVSRQLGVPPKVSLILAEKGLLTELVSAIILHENGYMPYAPEVVAEGVSRALRT